MSNVLSPATNPNCYFGMVKISLFDYWRKKHEGQVLLASNTFKEYTEMRTRLKDAGIPHRFEWVNTGIYLPDNVWIERSDIATAFVLKYGT